MLRKEEKTLEVLLMFVLVVAFFVFLSGSVLAGSFSSSSYQYRPSYDTYYSSSQIKDYWPVIADRDQCKARQDVLLQVSPAGCQPLVVRSDLLAEQNVPVFCEINALEINPLIKIEEIKNIRFTGKYPAEVVGAGFHPANAALNTRDKLLGEPVINNIGYVVVVLKKTEREEDLPDFVSLNLSGKIQYDSGNAFGIGRGEFVLEPIPSDDVWNGLGSGEKNSFWQGRYYLRLEDADSERATVSIYYGDKKISTVRVEKGKTSNDIFVPGQYCQAGLQVKYDGYVANEDSARIEISEDDGRDVIDVFEGSRILDGKCTVRKIDIGGVGTEKKNGNADENNVPISAGSVTLSCSGVRGDVVLKLKDRLVDENGELNLEIEDKLGDNDNTRKFYDAIEAYKRVVEDYPQERDREEGERIGESALEEALAFAGKAGETDKTKRELIELYLNNYPDSIRSISNIDALKALESIDFGEASKSVQIDGRFRTLNLLRVKSGNSETEVEISIGDEFKTIKSNGVLQEGKDKDNSGEIKLDKIEADRVRISQSCNDKESRQVELREGESKEICGRTVSVRRIDFEGIAKIRLEPKVKGTETETNLTVTVGIEKRAIKLSPEKSLEKIDNLNESIKKWEDISNNLGKFNKGLKSACFVTAGVLTVKNFLSGIDGSALGREHAMQGTNGWTERCGSALGGNELILRDGTSSGKTYGSIVECFNDNNDLIEQEVRDRAEIINNINEKIPDSDDSGIIDTQKLTDEFYDKVKSDCGSSLENDFGREGTWSDVGTTPWSLIDLREYCYANEMEKRGYSVFANAEKERLKKKVAGQTKDLNIFLGSKASNGLIAGSADLGGGTRVVRAKFFDTTSYNNILDDSSESKIAGKGYDTAVVITNAKNPTDSNQAKSVGKKFIVFGTIETGRFDPKEVYEYDEKIEGAGNDKKSVGNIIGKEGDINLGEFLGANEISPNGFENLGDLHGNKIMDKDQKVRFFGSGPDKGMPAIVPFDVQNGWYVKVQSSFEGIDRGIYQSNGLPTRWRVCNVGSNNVMDSDDECGVTDGSLGSGETILGLSQAESKRRVQISAEAILDAARQRNSKIVNINGQNLLVGNVLSHNDGVQCHDFMSANDCKLLFNVCDPVICPSTRCNLGGEYQVPDVIQTGIVGSALLCLPNAKEGIAIPVCTTGIQAGIDGYTNILKAHRDCLQENVETGKLTGICDEITSVYMCEFFWKQAAPLAKIALPTVIDKIFNGGTRGGGEYRNVQSALDNTEGSVKFFTQNYAGNSFKAFQARSVAEAGTPICRAFISAKAPSAFDALTDPDSPPQFHAWFDSFTHSDATVPATAQYKVFYTIYAGKDTGIHYAVYLKNPGDSVFFNIPESIQVDSGFIGRGEGATETKDFTAPEGYRELCVRINNEDYCGFKQVSTSFAVNVLRDEFVEGELGKTDINSEKECISGSTSLAALSNVNLQAGAEEALNPDIQQRGIVRTCSTINPGKSTDPTRYIDVGNCGNEKDRCWLDEKSVENALTDANKGAKRITLEELKQEQLGKLEGEGKIVNEVAFRGELEGIKKNGKSADEKISALDVLYNTLVFNHHKALLLLEKARILKDKFMPPVEKQDESSSGNSADAGIGGASNSGESDTDDVIDLKRSELNVRRLNNERLSFYYGGVYTGIEFDLKSGTLFFVSDVDVEDPVGFSQGGNEFNVIFVGENYLIKDSLVNELRIGDLDGVTLIIDGDGNSEIEFGEYNGRLKNDFPSGSVVSLSAPFEKEDGDDIYVLVNGGQIPVYIRGDRVGLMLDTGDATLNPFTWFKGSAFDINVATIGSDLKINLIDRTVSDYFPDKNNDIYLIDGKRLQEGSKEVF